MNVGVKSAWSVIKAFYPDLVRMIVLNLLWVVCSLPIITIPAATGGLAYATHTLIYDEPEYSWKLFFIGFRKTFWWIWRWVLPNLLIPFIFLFNIIFFQSSSEWINIIVRAGNILLLVGWAFLQTFTLPVLFEQEKQRMVFALRNSFAIFVHLPGFYFMTFFIFGLVLIISLLLVIPFFFVSVSFCMYFSISMLRIALQEMEENKKVSEKN